VYSLLKTTSNCFDKLQNGDETGVDCGGSCQLRCDGTYRDIKINFARGMKVDEGRYDIFALLENFNTNVTFPKVPYEVKFYSAEGKLLGAASGTLQVFPQSKAAIYLPNLRMNQDPKTIDLSLQPHRALAFYNTDSLPKQVSVENWQAQRGANNSLQVIGELKNPYNQEVKNMTVYAMLYDDTRTVYAVSKTEVPSVLGRQKTAVTFTWGNVITPTNADFIVVFNQ
jgi:hypothetical protein